eukprot:3407652-Karenia_brevis.AAC.1
MSKIIQRDDDKKLPEDWDSSKDPKVSSEVHERFSLDLYSLLVTLIEGEPNLILEGQSDSG